MALSVKLTNLIQQIPKLLILMCDFNNHNIIWIQVYKPKRKKMENIDSEATHSLTKLQVGLAAC